jgi:hypothetical protein
MAFNPMQQQQSPDMLMAMMTDPRATPQQRMAAMSALNTMRGGANAPQPPQMTGDGTGVSDMDPAFMAAVRQEMMGQGPEEQPEIAQRQAAPEAPQNPSTEALMSGAADASRVAAMAQGGAVKGYAGSGAVIGQDGLPPDPNELLRIATRAIDPITRFRARSALNAMRGQVAPPVAAPLQEVTAAPNFMRGQINSQTQIALPNQANTQLETTIDPNMPIGGPEGEFDSTEAKLPKKGKDYFALLEKMAEEGDSGAILAKDKYMALLQASLGTMAAASQPGGTFLGSIGQGGLLGVKQLQEAKAARAEDRMKKMTLYGTLAGRQEASEAAAAALEQRREDAKAVLAERIRHNTETEENIKRANEIRAADQLRDDEARADKVAEKIAGEEKSKAADRAEYSRRVKEWKKNGGVFEVLPSDDIYGFPNPQGEPFSLTEERKKPVIESRLTSPNDREQMIAELPDAQENFKLGQEKIGSLIKVTQRLKDHPGLDDLLQNVLRNPIDNLMSTESGWFKTDLDSARILLGEIVSGKSLQELMDMKAASKTGATGFGAMNAQELQTLQDAGSALKASLGTVEFPAALERYISRLKGLYKRNENSWSGNYGGLPEGYDPGVDRFATTKADPEAAAAAAAHDALVQEILNTPNR